MSDTKLTHLNERGEAHMVDVSNKPVTTRVAVAEGFVRMAPGTLAIIQSGTAKKGDVLATARIAGIMAAKKTHDLIPLCHPLALNNVTLDCAPAADGSGIRIEVSVRTDGKTGVEMEALTAVSIGCLTIYDMLKAVDRAMTISDVRLLQKSGGRSGDYRAGDSRADN